MAPIRTRGDSPLLPAVVSDISSRLPISKPKNGGVLVVAGHRLTWEWDGNISAAIKLIPFLPEQTVNIGLPYHAIMTTAIANNADIVILDLNPSGGSLNQCLVKSSDYFIVPAIADHFSCESISGFQEWFDANSQTKRDLDTAINASQQSRFPFPLTAPKFLGYVVSRYRATRNGRIIDGLADDSVAENDGVWMNRVAQTVQDIVTKTLRPANAFPELVYQAIHRSYCLGKFRYFHQLASLSGHFHCPVPYLESKHIVKLKMDKDLRKIVEQKFDNRSKAKMLRQIDAFRQAYEAFADTVLQLIALNSFSCAKWKSSDLRQYYTRVPFGVPIKSADEKENEARLEQRVHTLSMRLRPDAWIEKDGNCFFESLADQIMSCNVHYHWARVRKTAARRLRTDIVQWLCRHPDFTLDNGERIDQFLDRTVDSSWLAYCDRMNEDGAWADHIVCVAAAECLQHQIQVVTSAVGDRYIWPFVPTFSDPEAQIYRLGHLAEWHYRSLVLIDRPAETIPSSPSSSSSSSSSSSFSSSSSSSFLSTSSSTSNSSSSITSSPRMEVVKVEKKEKVVKGETKEKKEATIEDNDLDADLPDFFSDTDDESDNDEFEQEHTEKTHDAFKGSLDVKEPSHKRRRDP
eukprot:TRINITY_DN764_c1_g1_i1.p1 TRINITY_DN764_c1_g1~~TRINITY_DN764_c1_g1_i1.p1  ORF type:complete len:632 (+),score=154.22 TRINITY_DN764_c1_g1_i1:119-2014(+)